MERARTRNVRVGIDVGGTFTDVVAIDATTRELIARVKVPTTHDAREGVAAGIVAGIERLLQDPAIDAGAIAFIAHSTTQATNALLEGDLAQVGVVGLLDGLAWLSKRQMRFGEVALAGGSTFAPAFAFTSARDESAMRASVDRLIAAGAEAIAASESFGVDRPANEIACGCVRAIARRRRNERPRRERRVRPARSHPHRGAQRSDPAEDGPHRANDGRGRRARSDSRAVDGDAQRRRRDGRARGRTTPDLDAALGARRRRRGRALSRAFERGNFRRGRRHELGLFCDSQRPAADAGGANRRPSHDAAHARRAHAGHRRRKLAADRGQRASRRRAAQRPHCRLRVCFVRSGGSARRRAARTHRAGAARPGAVCGPDRARRTAHRANGDVRRQSAWSGSRGRVRAGERKGRATRLRVGRACLGGRASRVSARRARRCRREAAPRDRTTDRRLLTRS